MPILTNFVKIHQFHDGGVKIHQFHGGGGGGNKHLYFLCLSTSKNNLSHCTKIVDNFVLTHWLVDFQC